MITQYISAVCTLGLIVLAILIMTRSVSLEDALKATLKALFVLLVALVALCSLGPPLVAGVTALALLVKTAIHWLVVTVFVGALLILLVRVLLWRFLVRPKANGSPD